MSNGYKYDTKKYRTHPKVISIIDSCKTFEQLTNCISLMEIVPPNESPIVETLIKLKCYSLQIQVIDDCLKLFKQAI